MLVAEALRAATQRLAATSDTARLDAELLMAHALGCTRSDLLLRHMREPAPAGFAALVERRVRHEPVAYITAHAEFHSLNLRVTPAVLIPRGDSEVVVEAALALAPQPGRILDLGTGSGALLLAVLAHLPQARGVALDRSAEALAVAVDNARRLELAERVAARLADWHRPGWADDLPAFDLVLCNPPYVENDAPLAPSVRDYEPAGALFAGTDGLDDYRALLPQLPGLLNPRGVAVFEIGATQAEAVAAMAHGHGFATELRHDLAERPRALILRR